MIINFTYVYLATFLPTWFHSKCTHVYSICYNYAAIAIVLDAK